MNKLGKLAGVGLGFTIGAVGFFGVVLPALILRRIEDTLDVARYGSRVSRGETIWD